MTHAKLFVAGVVGSAALTPLAAGDGAIVSVGELSPGQGSTVTAVSASGDVVVGYALVPEPPGWAYRGFRWTRSDGIGPLGSVPGGGASYAQAANADGSVIVGQAIFPEGVRAFRWTSAGGFQSLGVLPGYASSLASAVSADGLTIAGSCYQSGTTSCVWAAGGMTDLGAVLASTNNYATGLSTAGDVIVGTGQPSYRWSQAGGVQHLAGAPGFPYAWAVGVSADGAVVIGHCMDANFPTQQSAPMRWGAGSAGQALPVMPGYDAGDALGVSADGAIIVGNSRPLESVPASLGHATLWMSGLGTVDLNVYLPSVGVNLGGWTLNSAAGISADGRVIVGIGHPSAQSATQGWVVTLSAAPGACYANCDGSTTAPILNVLDFTCFLQRFAAGDSYANCDASTTAPTLNVLDFTCFLQRFAAGCP